MSNIQKSNLQNIKDTLLSKGAIQLFKDAIPGVMGGHAEKAAERFAKLAYNAVAQSPALQKCTPASIAKAASICASLNLDIDPRGLAYLVPFKDQAVFIIGYQGLMELAFRSGKVKMFSAEVVYESEKDSIIVTREDGRIRVKHPFTWEKPKGKIIGCYSTVKIEGYGVHQHFRRIDEIEFFRSKSACPNSPAWKDHYEAMCKKTVIRQHCKWLPKSITKDVQSGIAAEENQTTKFVESVAVNEETIQQKSGSVPDNQLLNESPEEKPEIDEEFMQDE